MEINKSRDSSFTEHFRCFDAAPSVQSSQVEAGREGYFRFGDDVVCFGKTSFISTQRQPSNGLSDALPSAQISDHAVQLPFNLDQVTTNLRNEYYARLVREHDTKLPPNPIVRDVYYLARPFMSVGFRRVLQRIQLKGKTSTPFPRWPVDRTVDRLFERVMTLAIQANLNKPVPFIWFWPDGAPSAVILTHDVETDIGRDFCSTLMDIDDSFGFKSSFQVIPEKRYEVTEKFLESIRGRGFEVNVHDLNHDGNLFRSRQEFLLRAAKINEYIRRFDARGFRSGILYRNARWYDAFDFSYDMSIPNVGHLDPQGGGCCTLFPYFINDILEIPVTITQDYSLFNILNTYSIELWKQQCEAILRGNGLISAIVHPDYVMDAQPRACYRALLGYLAELSEANGIWSTIPGEIDRWWRQRNAMTLDMHDGIPKIKGVGADRARIAYAHLVEGQLAYTFDPARANHRGSERDQMRITSKPSVSTGASSLSQAQHENSEAFDHSGLPGQPLASSRHQMEASNDQGAAVDVLERAPTVKTIDPVPLPRKPLRVAMVSYSFYEADNRVMRYAETLAKRGDHVDVFALRSQGLAKDQVLDGVHVHRLQSRTINEKTPASYLIKITKFLFRAMYQVSRNHLRQKYDLLHIHSVPDFMVFTGLIPRLGKTPVILDIHDILPEFYASKFGISNSSAIFMLMAGVEKVSAAFSSHVIVANHIWQDRLKSRSVSGDKCSVILNCPDRSIFERSPIPPQRGSRFNVLYPGSLNWHQGLDLAVRAFAKIKDEVPEADFHIYGQGPTKESLKKLIRELRAENRIFIHDLMPLREVAQIMELADLGIVPKRKDSFGNEAFSTKILEFMTMGVPVIVADTQIDKFYFDDSVVAFFRGGDEGDLALRMLDLIRDARKRSRLAGNASEFVRKMDWTANKHEYLGLVERLVSRSSKRDVH